jgi:hypothetical protein
MRAATEALHVRKVDGELMRQIRMEAAAAGVHVREWVISVLERACGFPGEAARQDVINGRLELLRQAVGVGCRSARRSKAKGKGRSGPAAPEGGTVNPDLQDCRSIAEEEEPGTLKALTAGGQPRCQQHDETGWQCRLMAGHESKCM